MRKKTGQPIAAWITAGRQSAFGRNLEGFIENFTRHRTIVPVLIGLDDTTASLNAELELIQERHPAFPLYVSGLTDRLAFIENLPNNFEPSVIKNALIRREGFWSCGANRNSALLGSAGRPLLLTDDDVEPEPAILSSSYDEKETSFIVLPSRDSVFFAIQPVDIDIIKAHLQELRSKNALICTFGFYGITGSTVNRGILTLKGNARERFLEYEYTRIRDSPFTVRIPQHSRQTSETFLMASHSSYDASNILPPFFTAGRNDDGFFAHMTRLCYPESLTAYPAYGIYHNPEAIRTYSDETRTSFSLTLSELFMLVTAWAARQLVSVDAGERIAELGSILCNVATMTDHEITNLIYKLALPSVMAYKNNIETVLVQYAREPLEWAQDVDRLLEHIEKLERDPALLYGTHGCGLSVTGVKDEFHEYGSLLQVWPALWDYACEKNKKAPCTARKL